MGDLCLSLFNLIVVAWKSQRFSIRKLEVSGLLLRFFTIINSPTSFFSFYRGSIIESIPEIIEGPWEDNIALPLRSTSVNFLGLRSLEFIPSTQIS
jgi:hypothetical protein